MDTLARLEALEDIRLIQARYWRMMDMKQWDELRSVFTDDAIVNHPGERGGKAQGADAVVAYIRERVGDVQTVHQGFTPEITFDSDTVASSIWPYEDLLQWPEGTSLKGVSSLHGWGHYRNRYQLTESGWLISYLSVSRLRLETNGQPADLAGHRFSDHPLPHDT